VDYRALVVLSVRTAGLILLLRTLSLAPDRVAAFVFGSERSITFFVGAILVPILVPLVVGWFLLAFPASSTRGIGGEPFASGTELERLLQPIVFAAIGLYYLVGGLADIGYYLALKAFDDGDYGTARLFANPQYSAGFINAILRTVVGVGLLLGARGLSGVISRFRQGV